MNKLQRLMHILDVQIGDNIVPERFNLERFKDRLSENNLLDKLDLKVTTESTGDYFEPIRTVLTIKMASTTSNNN